MDLNEMLLIKNRRQEKTAKLTHLCLIASRILFLFFHGLLVLSVSLNLRSSENTSWWVAFTPVWVGDAFCAVLVIASWFASCPYIQLCIEEKQPRVGDNNPSLLTEILPDIAMAVLALLFIILVLCGEYALCKYLENEYHGEPSSLVAPAVLLGTVSVLAICHGVCIKRNTAMFALPGAGFLITLFIVLATENSRFVMVPSIVAVLGFIVVASWRLRVGKQIFTREERALRRVEWCALLALLLLLLSMAKKIAGPEPLDATLDGMMVGSVICLVAVLRACMCVVEMKHGPFEDRLMRLMTSANNLGSNPNEVAMTPIPGTVELGEGVQARDLPWRNGDYNAQRLNIMSA